MRSKSILPKLGMVLAESLLCLSAASFATVVTYPKGRLDSLSPDLTMTIGGTPVNVYAVPSFLENDDQTYYFSYARFGITGSNAVSITKTSNWSTATSIQPEPFNITLSGQGTRTLTFTLDEGKIVRILMGGNTQLWLLSDPLESNPPQPGDANVKSVMDFVSASDTTGSTTITTKLQSAIDWVAANYTTKPILYFPNGEYRSGTLYPKSNVQMYLQSGACIKGSAVTADFPDAGIHYDNNVNRAFFHGRKQDNWKVYGRGVIDVQGLQWDRTNARSIMCFWLDTCNSAKVQGIMLRNGDCWHGHFNQSNNCRVDGIRIFSPGGADAWSINNANHDTISNVMAIMSDDGFSVGNHWNVADGNHDNIVFGCYVATTYFGHSFRISICQAAPCYNNIFRDSYSFDNRSGAIDFEDYVWSTCSHTGSVHDIRWENIWATSERNWDQTRFISGENSNGSGAARYNLDIANCAFSSSMPGGSLGSPNHDIRFVNLKKGNTCCTNANQAGISNNGASNVTFTCNSTAALDLNSRNMPRLSRYKLLGDGSVSCVRFASGASTKDRFNAYSVSGKLIGRFRTDRLGRLIRVPDGNRAAAGAEIME